MPSFYEEAAACSVFCVWGDRQVRSFCFWFSLLLAPDTSLLAPLLSLFALYCLLCNAAIFPICAAFFFFLVHISSSQSSLLLPFSPSHIQHMFTFVNFPQMWKLTWIQELWIGKSLLICFRWSSRMIMSL